MTLKEQESNEKCFCGGEVHLHIEKNEEGFYEAIVPVQPQPAWETLFDKQFSDEGIDLPDERHSSYPYFQGTQQCKDIKDFIRNLIAQTENEVYNMGYEDALQGLPRSQKNKG